MGDLRLPQFDDTYSGWKFRAMVDTLENTFSGISRVFANVKKSSYQLTADTTPVGNINAGIDTLISYTLPANTMAKDGYSLEIKAWGIFAANANNKELRLLLGSSVLYDSGVVAANGGSWMLTSTITRTGTATEQAITSIITSNTTVGNSTTYLVPTESLSATILIKCTGEATTTNDIVQKGLLIRVFPQE